MRLSRVLLGLCLLFGARASQLNSRVPHALDTRELLDVCATIVIDPLDVNLLELLTLLGLVGSSSFLSNLLA